ncbi:hypothetical protein ACLMJK_008072 [Lecanora helva]
MTPIRVGMIGLSATAKTSWASAAHLPYLQACNDKFTITALCNSSVSAAQAAIEAYDLPPNTKAYGNPEDLADDTEIVLIVCNVRTYTTRQSSLVCSKGRMLAANLKDAQELNRIAKENGSRTMIGLQGQLAPLIIKLKSLIEKEIKIGKVLSSSVLAFGGTRTRDSVIQGLKYFTQQEIGGNMVTIGFGHMIDFVEKVLGEISPSKTQLNIQRPQIDILGSDGKTIERTTTDVADHIMLQGTLKSGAPLAVVFRRGPPFKDDPSFTWLIHGEKGEIKVTSATVAVQATNNNHTIAIHDFEEDDIDFVQWDSPFKDLPDRARNVAAMYEAFAEADVEQYPDFDHAVLRHVQLDQILRNS